MTADGSPRRILAFGNFQHPFCSEVHFARELESLGHLVHRLQEPPGGGNVDTIAEIHRLVARHQLDLVMWTRTWGMPPGVTTALWRALEDEGVQTISRHLDLYVGLQREANVMHDPFWTTGTVFTPDGDPTSQAWFEDHGINHVYSPPGVVSDECVPGTFRSELAHDVVFVGSPASAYHPEWRHRGQLLHFLERTYGKRFVRYGPGAKRMRGQDLNNLYASAKVVVGDNLCLPGHTRYSTDRPWETVGRGGFLLQPYSPGMEEHFADGQHLRWYNYGEFGELKQMIDGYLDDSDERHRIATTGQEHVRTTATYRHRFAADLETLATLRP